MCPIAQSIEPGGRAYPGNKRQGAARLIYSTKGEQFTAAPKERAAVIGALPVWLLAAGLQADEVFLAGLEGVLAGTETVDALVSRYQRRGSYGHRVLLSFAEGAVQRVAEQLMVVERTPVHVRICLRVNLSANGALACFPSAALKSLDRQRWRVPAWRQRAVEALLAIGAGRCLAEGCDDPTGQHYCAAHTEYQRNPTSTPQANPTAAQARHDALVASVAELLREVGALLGSPAGRT